MIEALRRLCDREGGYVAVADRAELNDQSIYQIISGVKLPSGEPKGVGPKIQKALTAAYPGWENLAVSDKLTKPSKPQWPFHEVEFERWSRLSPVHKSWVEKAMLDEIEKIEARAALKTGTGS